LTGEEQLQSLRRAITWQAVKLGEDQTAIRDATLALDQATRRFAELMMEAAVTTAIRGKTMGEAGEELGERRHRSSSHGCGGVQVLLASRRVSGQQDEA
jgi:hypothetical protein